MVGHLPSALETPKIPAQTPIAKPYHVLQVLVWDLLDGSDVLHLAPPTPCELAPAAGVRSWHPTCVLTQDGDCVAVNDLFGNLTVYDLDRRCAPKVLHRVKGVSGRYV